MWSCLLARGYDHGVATPHLLEDVAESEKMCLTADCVGLSGALQHVSDPQALPDVQCAGIC